MARVRVRDGNQAQSLYTHLDINGNVDDEVTTTRYQSHDSCTDSLGASSDHPLTLSHDVCSDGHFDWAGTYHGVGQIGVEIGGHTSMNSTISSWISGLTAQRIAASTAPLSQKVNVVTDFLEFRDIPRMLKHAGDLLHGLKYNPVGLARPKIVASTVLAYQFGWAPILQDLQRMADFGNLVANRQREIGELNSGKVIRRRVKFGSISGTESGNRTIHSTFGITITSPYHMSWTAEGWATIHWQLSDMRLLGRKPSWWEAFSGLYGLSAGTIPVQVWKALPWSWAIDWFAHVSDALEVARNLISYQPSRINRMWKVSMSGTFQPVNPLPTKRFAGMTRVITRLNRDQPSISGVTGIHLNVPFLDAFKLSVLSSLTIVKLARR